MGCLKLRTEYKSTALKVVYKNNQAGAHGITGGLMNAINGQEFGAGFASGAIASLIGHGMKGAVTVNGEITNFGNSVVYKALVLASGRLSAGISSTIAGGDFWQGVKQVLITTGLTI